MKMQFLGAACTVTGSKTLIETNSESSHPTRVLVDCGLFQGQKELRLKNREVLGVDPSSIHAVLLTHAHLDHSGYLPLLVKNGFQGKVFCTAPTRDLTRIVLLDAGSIQEEDAGFANQEGFSKHKPALPLFTVKDAERAIERLEIVRDGEWFSPSDGIRVRYRKNGHILGSCSIQIEADGKRITFSGDLGRRDSLLHRDPESLEPTDFLVLESTYGDRDHPLTELESEAELERVIERMIHRKGQLVIPSFAIGRTQEVLLLLTRLREKGKLPESIPVFLDSPMGVRASDVLKAYPGWHKIPIQEIEKIEALVQVVSARDQSLQLSNSKNPKIIVAGSGMASGGRVLHHLSHLLPDPKTTVLFVGFQALGTRGRDLIEGKREIKIHGKQIYVRAHMEKLESLSAHAGQSELLGWIRESILRYSEKPTRVFLQHGESQASQALKAKIESDLDVPCCIPDFGESFDLHAVTQSGEKK